MTSVSVSIPTGLVRKPQVYVMGPPKEQLTEKTVSLTCLASGFLPNDIDVEWTSSGRTEKNYKNTEPVMDSDGSFFMYSKLNVERSRWDSGASFFCSVVHEGLHNRHVEKSISRLPGK